MVSVVARVLGLVDLRGLFHGRDRIARGVPGLARSRQVRCRRRIHRDRFLAVVPVAARRTVPPHLERIPAAKCRPRGLGDDADAEGHPHDADHAGDGTRGAVVDRCRGRALHGAAQNRRIEHAWKLHVDAVYRAAIHLRRQLDPHHVLPDVAVLGRFLQLLRLDRRRLRRDLRDARDVAVADPASGRGVHHRTRLGGKLGERRIQQACGVDHHHPPHLGSEGARGVPVPGDRRRAGGVHQAAEARVAVDLVVRGRGNDHHAVPVGVHLVRDDAR